jgi:S1-C subfamily serine protease
MGNPFGLGSSVSRGILSAKNRRPIQEGAPMEMRDWLQTDAAINPGNSGGPLINLEGEVIGINVAIYKEGQGIGFAIPIKRVRESLAEIYTPSTLGSLWFGARVKPGETPLRVAEVHPESPAAKAGLQPGDQVMQINSQVPKSFIDFTNRLIEAGRNRPASLLIRRGEQQQTVQVRLVPEGSMFNAGLIRQKTGASVQPLTPELAEGVGLSRSGGLIISAVDPNSPAARAGLKQNHVIVGIDGHAIQDLTTAARMLYERSGQKVALDVVVEESLGVFVRRQTLKVELQVR